MAGNALEGKGIAPLGKFSTYDPLFDEIIRLFNIGKSLVSEDETMEIFSFMKAADISKEINCLAVRLNEIDND